MRDESTRLKRILWVSDVFFQRGIFFIGATKSKLRNRRDSPQNIPWIMGSHHLVNGYQDSRDLLHNHSSKPWVVQKFGGTSIGKFADKIAEDVVRWAFRSGSVGSWTDTTLSHSPSLHGNRIAVVCSARSGSTKLEGTTNRQVFENDARSTLNNVNGGSCEPPEKPPTQISRRTKTMLRVFRMTTSHQLKRTSTVRRSLRPSWQPCKRSVANWSLI